MYIKFGWILFKLLIQCKVWNIIEFRLHKLLTKNIFTFNKHYNLIVCDSVLFLYFNKVSVNKFLIIDIKFN